MVDQPIGDQFMGDYFIGDYPTGYYPMGDCLMGDYPMGQSSYRGSPHGRLSRWRLAYTRELEVVYYELDMLPICFAPLVQLIPMAKPRIPLGKIQRLYSKMLGKSCVPLHIIHGYCTIDHFVVALRSSQPMHPSSYQNLSPFWTSGGNKFVPSHIIKATDDACSAPCSVVVLCCHGIEVANDMHRSDGVQLA